MSPQDSSKPTIATDKPGTNIYTVMLILALIAISVGCLLLFLELRTYGTFPWWNAR